MTPEPTLNVTIPQIEEALLKGQTVPDFAKEWAEPPGNVLAVYRRLQREGRIPVNGPAQVATSPRTPLVSVKSDATPPPPIDKLAQAAARSTSKRTQALGVKLADLAAVVRQRLADEHDADEKAERERVEREAAAAEVERLERQLTEARAKLQPSRKGASSRRSYNLSDDERRRRSEQMKAMQAKRRGAKSGGAA